MTGRSQRSEIGNELTEIGGRQLHESRGQMTKGPEVGASEVGKCSTERLYNISACGTLEAMIRRHEKSRTPLNTCMMMRTCPVESTHTHGTNALRICDLER